MCLCRDQEDNLRKEDKLMERPALREETENESRYF